MCPRRSPFRVFFAVTAILSATVCEGFGIDMSIGSPRTPASGDSIGSRLARSNSHQPKVRLPSTASEAVAAGVSTEAYQGPGLRSRIYEGIKKRIDDRKKKVEDIADIHEFQSLIASERESIVAVMFHAPFCKACQASMPLFHRMAKKYKTVKFLSVPLTEYNKDKLKRLGVEKFPFGRIYDPDSGLIAELPVLRKLIPRFEDRLRSLLKGESLDED